jgi:hypothetical protein
LACMAGETPESWMGPMRTAGEVMVKFDSRELLRAQAAGESGFHRCLDAFGRQHFFECLADSFEHGAVGGQEAVIEREALVKLGVEFFARAGAADCRGAWGRAGWRRRQREEQPLAVTAELDHREEAGIVELLGASFHFGGGQARVRFEAGGREQLLLRVLRRALKADRLGRSFFLRQQRKRAKQKQSYTDCARLFESCCAKISKWSSTRPALPVAHSIWKDYERNNPNMP